MFSNNHSYLRVVLLSGLAVVAGAGSALAQGPGCRGLLLSTSEDFFMQDTEDQDGNRVVSDGDLLAFDAGSGGTTICRRNRELLAAFDIPRIDFGLDAVAAVDRQREILVFSTELDDPKRRFTAGDLIFTTGLVIPNQVLTQRFDLAHDIGLDAVSLLGGEREWRQFMEKFGGMSREEMLRQRREVLGFLEEAKMDILFSTEGTAPSVEQPRFIDGDLLSAVSGTIFRANSALLPALPAGIPSRGVDWGLDAYTFGEGLQSRGAMELFSTEIVGEAEGPFTDGDALGVGPVVVAKNFELLKSLTPATFDLGLDALHMDAAEFTCAPPSITRISNVYVSEIDGQGLATTGATTDRPFGGVIRVQGAMPLAVECPQLANFEFRVELDEGGGFPGIGDPNTLTIPAGWLRQLDGNPSPSITDCVTSIANPRTPYQPDAMGWFNLADYRRFDECGEDESVAVWNSSGRATNVEAGDPPVTVRFRLVMREVGAPGYYSVSAPVRVRLDNNNYALPATKDTPLTGDMSMTFGVASGSDASVTDCDITAGSADVILNLLGRARDQHFWYYSLRWSGGDAVGWRSITPSVDAVFDNDATDRAEISLGGTVPGNSTTVLLSEFNLTQAHQDATGGTPPIECGYVVELRAHDRTIAGSFNAGNNSFGTTHRWNAYPLAFCFQPG